MKFKKLFFLPLVTLVLASCTMLGNSEEPKTSTSTPTSTVASETPPTSTVTSEPPGVSTGSSLTTGSTTISREEANLRVANALEQTISATFTSLDIMASADVEIGNAFLDAEKEVQSSSRMSLVVEAGLKASGLDTAAPEAALNIDLQEFVQEVDDEVVMDLNADIALYYVDEFAYLDFAAHGQQAGMTEPETLAFQQKMEVGPFPGFGEEDGLPVELPIEIEEIGEMLPMLGFDRADEVNGVLVVRYEMTQQDVVDLALEALLPEGQEPTPEELEAFEALISEMIKLEDARLRIEVGADGFLKRFNVDVDLEINAPVEDYDELLDDVVIVGYERTSIVASVLINININKPVQIFFPDDLGDYELVDDFPEIFDF